MTGVALPNDAPTPLEIATSIVFGRADGSPALDRRATTPPRTALEQALVPALRRAPCIVSFSGGRDSSALLAVATRLARRECLPAPIPATLRFPDADLSDEAEWQDALVRRLGCTDWIRLDHTHELD